MREVIRNSKGETAVIYKINAKKFDPLEFKNLSADDLPRSYRRYLFIDDIEDSLNTRVVGKFAILFERSGLSCARYNNGKVFPIDYITKEKDLSMDFEPRHGQDGGVVGACY